MNELSSNHSRTGRAIRGKKVSNLLKMFQLSSNSNKNHDPSASEFKQKHLHDNNDEDVFQLNRGAIKSKRCMLPILPSPTPPNSSNDLEDMRDPIETMMSRDSNIRSAVMTVSRSPEVRREHVLEQLELHKRERFESIKQKKKLERTERSQQHRRAENRAFSSSHHINDVDVMNDCNNVVHDPKFSVEPAIPEHKRGIVDVDTFVSPKKVKKGTDPSKLSKTIWKTHEKCEDNTDDSGSFRIHPKSWKDILGLKSRSSWLIVSSSVAIIGIGGILAMKYCKKK